MHIIKTEDKHPLTHITHPLHPTAIPHSHILTSYAHEMFEKAIDPSKWNTKCSNVECPFCLNAKLLRDDPDRLSALIKTLRAFELATGIIKS